VQIRDYEIFKTSLNLPRCLDANFQIAKYNSLVII